MQHAGGGEFEVYASGLEEVRRRRRIFWIVFFCFVGILAWSFFGPYPISSMVGVRLGLAAVVWMIMFWVNHAECPRCGKKFHCKTSPWNLSSRWSDKCVHCALELNPPKR